MSRDEKDWLDERAKALEEAEERTRQKTFAELAFDLEQIADDMAQRAGDMPDMDDAQWFLEQEAVAMRAAELVRKLGLNNPPPAQTP